MTAIAPYRIISYILLPIAALFGFMGLLMLILALSNPAIMIPTLIIMVIVVYIILSFIFFMKAVENGKKCKPTLRKWITATGIIAGFPVVVAIARIFGVNHFQTPSTIFFEIALIPTQIIID